MQAELDKIQTENPAVHMTPHFDHGRAHAAHLPFLPERASSRARILAVLVVWLFLRSWRATLISALAIPLSAIPTFAFMQWMGFTLNQITLLALSLVAGVLVDDAIVEIENIVRHMRMGKSGFQAALDAADEIGLAVVATSFTIIAVFLPVSFMGGIIGQFFKQFGLTVAAAVFISLMVARLITPVLAAYALKRRFACRIGRPTGPIMTRVPAALRWCALHRWKTVGRRRCCSSPCRSARWRWFRRPSCRPRISPTAQLDIELPPGGTLEDTARVSAAAAARPAQVARSDRRRRIRRLERRGAIRNAVIYIEPGAAQPAHA